MKQTLLFLLFPLLASAQETTTFTVDTLGDRNVQLTTITTYLRPDSTVYETRSSVRFKNKGEARKHIVNLFAEKLAADSITIETTRRHRAGLMASREALLNDLGREGLVFHTHTENRRIGGAVHAKLTITDSDSKSAPTIERISICWDGANYIPCSQKKFLVGEGDTAYYTTKWVADPPHKAFLVIDPNPGYSPSNFITTDNTVITPSEVRWDLGDGFTVPIHLQLNPTVYPANIPPAEAKLPTIKQAKPKAAKTKKTKG